MAMIACCTLGTKKQLVKKMQGASPAAGDHQDGHQADRHSELSCARRRCLGTLSYCHSSLLMLAVCGHVWTAVRDAAAVHQPDVLLGDQHLCAVRALPLVHPFRHSHGVSLYAASSVLRCDTI